MPPNSQKVVYNSLTNRYFPSSVPVNEAVEIKSTIGNQNLMAFVNLSVKNVVLILEFDSMQLIQSLAGHIEDVSALEWVDPPESTFSNEASCRLFSGDVSGTIILWDVAEGTILRSRNFGGEIGALLYGGDAIVATVGNKLLLLDLSLKVKWESSSLRPNRKVVNVSPLAGGVAVVYGQSGANLVQIGKKVSCLGANQVPELPVSGSVSSIFFCRHQPNIILVACGSRAALYDADFSVILESCFAECGKDCEFLALFETGNEVLTNVVGEAAFYSFSSDMQLSAWIADGTKRVQVSEGVVTRQSPRDSVVSVCQSPSLLNTFGVIFSSGSVNIWAYSESHLYWSQVKYMQIFLPRPVVMAVAGIKVVTSSQDGEIVLSDFRHGNIQSCHRLISLNNTKPIAVLSLDDAFVVLVSAQVIQHRHHTQVSKIDLESGKVHSIIRKAPSTTDPAPVCEATLNSTKNLLLLLFGNGCFEVWNVISESQVHSQSGGWLSYACWAQPEYMFDPRWGPSQLLVTMLQEGGIQYYRAYSDHLEKIPEVFPLRLSTGGTHLVKAVIVDDALVCFDGAKGASLLRGFGSEGKWGLLPHCPKYIAVEAVAGQEKTVKALVAACFADGTFGVWDTHTRKSMGYSTSNNILKNTFVITLAWLQTFLAVLTREGNILLCSNLCMFSNTSILAKCLSRPLRSCAFLLPMQGAYLYNALQLGSWDILKKEDIGKTEHSGIQHSGDQGPPFHNCFGQLITEDDMDADERERLFSTVVPPWLTVLFESSKGNALNMLTRCFWTNVIFGNVQKRAFWATVMSQQRDDGCPLLHKMVGSFSAQGAFPNFFLSLEASCSDIRSKLLDLVPKRMTAIGMDGSLKLQLARQCLMIDADKEATDILLSCNPSDPKFAQLSLLACAISSSREGSAFVDTCATIADVLLKKGDVDGAIEKFLMTKDYLKACWALQGAGRWEEAALLAFASSLKRESQIAVIEKWMWREAAKGSILQAASSAVRINQLQKAVSILASDPQKLDVAGALCLYLKTERQSTDEVTVSDGVLDSYYAWVASTGCAIDCPV